MSTLKGARFVHADLFSIQTTIPRLPVQLRGAAIANFGGKVVFNAETQFDDNYASSSGDGGMGAGIYNEDGGDVT